MSRLLALEKGFGHPMGALGPWVMDPRNTWTWEWRIPPAFPEFRSSLLLFAGSSGPEAPVTVRLEVREKAEKPAPDIRQPRLQRVILSL